MLVPPGYWTQRASDSTGFSIELYRRRFLRRSELTAAVRISERIDEPIAIYTKPGTRANEVLDEFIEQATTELEAWRADWLAAGNEPY